MARENALVVLRRSNFKRLASSIDNMISPPAASGRRLRLLDVGCAHGWFLEQTRGRYESCGIEPDHAVAKATAKRGLPVREGFFPAALQPDERYDVIVFNDVLEHIPDINGTMQACMRHLSPGGLLVINAPNRFGAFYRISKKFLQIGRPKAFERMWQMGFPSPHVHYLDTSVMARLAERHGFALCDSQQLPSVSIRGLYSRVRYSKDVSVFKALLLTLAISAAIPVFAALPSDIKVWFLRRKSNA